MKCSPSSSCSSVLINWCARRSSAEEKCPRGGWKPTLQFAISSIIKWMNWWFNNPAEFNGRWSFSGFKSWRGRSARATESQRNRGRLQQEEWSTGRKGLLYLVKKGGRYILVEPGCHNNKTIMRWRTFASSVPKPVRCKRGAPIAHRPSCHHPELEFGDGELEIKCHNSIWLKGDEEEHNGAPFRGDVAEFPL